MGNAFLKLLLTCLLFLFFLPLFAVSSDLGDIGLIFIIILAPLFVFLGIKLQNSIDNNRDTNNSQEEKDISPHATSPVPSASPPSLPSSLSPIDTRKELPLIAQFEITFPSTLFNFIWACSDNFNYRLSLNWILHQQSYYCAACFYVAVKSIRNQQVVDNIYAHFQEDTRDYFGRRLIGLEPYVIIVNSYKKFAPILNTSSIDPRSPEGLIELWDLLQRWIDIPKHNIEFAKSLFLSDCSAILEYSKRILLATSMNHNFGINESSISPLVSKIRIPADVYFIDDLIPVKGIISKEKPFGDFTVYVSEYGTKYHIQKNCVYAPMRSKHLYETQFGYRPCSRCAKYTRNIAPDWYRKIKTIAQDRSYYK